MTGAAGKWEGIGGGEAVRGGCWKLSPIFFFWWIGTDTGETLHSVYLTMLSVCAYHVKNHKCRERSQKKGLFPFPQQYPSCSGWFMTHKGERNTHFYVSFTNTLSHCHRWSAATHPSCHIHISTWTYACTHTHTLKVATPVHLSVVAIIFNLTPGDQQTIIKPSRKQSLMVLKP